MDSCLITASHFAGHGDQLLGPGISALETTDYASLLTAYEDYEDQS